MTDKQTGAGPASPPITGAALYGHSGRPQGSDITQGALGDCYLVSTLGQYADRQPAVIQDAIHYSAKDQTFSVRLHDGAGHPRTITVTQGDLRQDRTYGPRHSGGVDSPAFWAGNHPDGAAAPAWPSVMETAYAKLNATSPQASTRADLTHVGNGGWPKDAIHALTGSSATRDVAAAAFHDPGKAYDLLHGSIAEGRPMVLATSPMKDMPTDGLVKGDWRAAGGSSGHAYTVEDVGRDAKGNVFLTLRNPWGNNKAPMMGVNSRDPVVHVALKTILDNGHLQSVTIGPARVQTKDASQTGHEHAVPPKSAPAAMADAHSGSSQAAAQELARSYWSGLAAGASQGTQTQSANQTAVLSQGRGRSL